MRVLIVVVDSSSSSQAEGFSNANSGVVVSGFGNSSMLASREPFAGPAIRLGFDVAQLQTNQQARNQKKGFEKTSSQLSWFPPANGPSPAPRCPKIVTHQPQLLVCIAIKKRVLLICG